MIGHTQFYVPMHNNSAHCTLGILLHGYDHGSNACYCSYSNTHVLEYINTHNTRLYVHMHTVHIVHREWRVTLLCKASSRVNSSREKAAFKDTHVQLEAHISTQAPSPPWYWVCHCTCGNKQIMLERHTKPIIRCKITASHFLSLSNEMFHMSK